MSSMTARRDFLRILGAGVAGVTLPAVATGAPPLPPAAEPDEAYWRVVKAQFALRDNVVPMNSANLCPAPRNVMDAVTEAMRAVEGDVSFQNRAQFDALRDRVRARLAGYFGVDADEIAIVRNASEGNNIIAGGVSLVTGDEVVLHAENHASNSVSWDVRAARYGFTIRRVAVQPAMSEAEMVAAFAAALTPRTKVLSFTDISNTTGIRLPARTLCALARERGRDVHVHIDGAQSFGVTRLDLRAVGCDSYASSAHKWLMGPKEAGVLYVRAAIASRVWPGVVSVGWGNGAQSTLPGARRFEAIGQRNDATIAGLDAALTFQESIGYDAIQTRVFALAALAKERLAAIPGAQLTTPRDAARSGGVVIARFGEIDHRQLYERLYSDAHVAGAATGGLRLCPHIYNTSADVQHATDAVAKIVATLKA
jgi:selenocysteine lyase/cysteine desulfurase